jgi:hypothetical protein
VDDPTGFLVEPAEPDADVNAGFANPTNVLNLASPSAWVNSAINDLTGVDVYDWMTEWLSGDWQALWKFGDAMGNLATCLRQLAFNTQREVIDVDASWDGNASDAAYEYFSNLAAAVSEQYDPLNDIRDNYHKAAVGAWQLANQLGNILQALADRVILAGIAAAAGTVTAESGVGAVVGYGVSALIVVDMLRLVNNASVIINTAGIAIVGLFGAIMDGGYQGGALATTPLPAVAYSKPGA